VAKPQYLDEIEVSDVPHVNPGHYLAVLEGVERRTTRYGEALRWHWTLPNEDNFEFVQMTSTATTGGSNAGRNVCVLRGRGLAPGERLPTGEIVGQYATLELSINPETGWNRVEDITPANRQLSEAATQAYAAEADGDGLPF
jgi:hypothetical protein